MKGSKQIRRGLNAKNETREKRERRGGGGIEESESDYMARPAHQRPSSDDDVTARKTSPEAERRGLRRSVRGNPFSIDRPHRTRRERERERARSHTPHDSPHMCSEIERHRFGWSLIKFVCRNCRRPQRALQVCARQTQAFLLSCDEGQ